MKIMSTNQTDDNINITLAIRWIFMGGNYTSSRSVKEKVFLLLKENVYGRCKN